MRTSTQPASMMLKDASVSGFDQSAVLCSDGPRPGRNSLDLSRSALQKAALSDVNVNCSVPAAGKAGVQSSHKIERPEPRAVEAREGSRKLTPQDLSDAAFDKYSILGTGASSVVYLARHTASNTLVALKEIAKEFIRAHPGMDIALKAEINVHRTLRHPNIVRLYSYYTTAASVVLVMEPCGATLADKLAECEERVMLPEQAACYTRQVARALAFLHDKRYVHRDVKLENVLIHEDGNVRLADFGWAKLCSEREARKTVCGTLDYLAPEVLTGSAPQSPAADVWSLGVMLYELLAGTAPFYHPSRQATLSAIQRADLTFPAHFGQDARELLAAMLARDPSRRPLMAEVLQHRFLAPRPRC